MNTDLPSGVHFCIQIQSNRYYHLWIVDALGRFEFYTHWQWLGQISYIKMRDVVNHQESLVNTPPSTTQFIKNFNRKKFQHLVTSVRKLIPDIYFVTLRYKGWSGLRTPYPDGYLLLGAELTSDFSIRHHNFKCALRCENLLNTTYETIWNEC